MGGGRTGSGQEVVSRLSKLRLNQHRGRRAPHKPLLVLLALGRLASTGASRLRWTETEPVLSRLISEFGPPSTTPAAQRAAYPFTHLRSDGVWTLDHDEVPMGSVRALNVHDIVGQLEHSLEETLRADTQLLHSVARTLIDSHFPATVAPDILAAVGLEPDLVLQASGDALPDPTPVTRRRTPGWRLEVLLAWDNQCAFCGYDGQFSGASVGIEAAHVRWFSFGGPDSLDNGLALCVLHHKLFDLGVMGLDQQLRVQVSKAYTARTRAGRAQYDLHGRKLDPRPGTELPASRHVVWHREQVFKGQPLAA